MGADKIVALDKLPAGFVIDEPLPSGFLVDGAPESVDRSDDDSIIAAMARQIYGPLKGGMEAAGGLVSGLKRQEVSPDASEAEKAGQLAGRYALPAAGTLAAGALTGGAGLVPAAAAVGLGAGAGEAASQITSRALGGEYPETVEEAAMSIGKTGLETAAVELGLGGAVALIGKVAPQILQSMKVVKAEALKRMIERPKVLRQGNATLLSTEIRGAVSLRKVQRAVESERKALGDGVEAALKKFKLITKDKPIIDTRNAANAVDEVLRSGKISNKAVAEAVEDMIPAAEVVKIRKLTETLADNPLLSASDAIKLRRKIDSLVEFRHGGVPPVSSELGQRALNALGGELRDAIRLAAKTRNFKQLGEANARFSRFAEGYEGIRRDIGTKLSDSGALRDKLVKIGAKYNEGGLPQQRLLNLKNIVPNAAKDVDAMLDFAAAREFVKGVAETPSGIAMSHWRGIITSMGVARGLPVAKQAEYLTRILRRAGGASAASAKNE